MKGSTGVRKWYEEAIFAQIPVDDPTDPGDAADLSTP